MRHIAVLVALVAAGAAAFLSVSRTREGADTSQVASDVAYTDDFSSDADSLVATGRNPWFVLEPGYTLELSDGDEELIITVLDETRVINGVETRVVEERESAGGRLVEVSRNFFAISRRTNNVYYFGEEVDMYRDGAVVSHDGAWVAGQNGARHGLMMAGVPLLGARYYQEVAPDVAMDRAEISSLTAQLNTPAGNFTELLDVLETTPLEPNARESKLFARGIGLVRDGSLVLVRYSGQGGGG
jgi:hypothetical protein